MVEPPSEPAVTGAFNLNWDLAKRLPAYPEITPEAVKLYLSYLSIKGVKRHSAIMAGIEPSRLRALIKKDNELAALEQAALEEYHEQIDMEIHSRAITGQKKAVYFKGKIIGYDTVKSDRLLEFMARANNPEKYREHVQVDATVRAGVLVVQQSLDPDDWEKQYGDMRTDKKRVESACTQPDQTSE